MARNDERIGRVWVLVLAIFGRRIVCGQVQASKGRYGIQQVIGISAKVVLFSIMWVVVAAMLMAGWVHAAQQLTLQQSMQWAGCSRCSIAKVWIQKGAWSYDAKGIHKGLVEGGRMGRRAVVGTGMGEGGYRGDGRMTVGNVLPSTKRAGDSVMQVLQTGCCIQIDRRRMTYVAEDRKNIYVLPYRSGISR